MRAAPNLVSDPISRVRVCGSVKVRGGVWEFFRVDGFTTLSFFFPPIETSHRSAGVRSAGVRGDAISVISGTGVDQGRMRGRISGCCSLCFVVR